MPHGLNHPTTGMPTTARLRDAVIHTLNNSFILKILCKQTNAQGANNIVKSYGVNTNDNPRTSRLTLRINSEFLFVYFQAAEKALKAVHYKEDANQKTNDHNLKNICCGFNDRELTELASQLEELVVNLTSMRYPDKFPRPKIPNDAYTADDAEEALEIATKFLEKVRNRLN